MIDPASHFVEVICCGGFVFLATICFAAWLADFRRGLPQPPRKPTVSTQKRSNHGQRS